MTDFGWLAAAIFAVALLYSSVGHAGASGYIAVLTLFGLGIETGRPTALTLNILVALVGVFHWWRAGHFSWALFWPFALFLGVALAVTAFPVLARILKDRRLQHTRVGRLALSATALLDVAAWIVLALLVALTGGGDWTTLLRTLAGLALLLAVVYGGLRPLYAWLLHRHAHDGRPSGTVLAALLVGLFACAAATEWLHLHAVFGAFLFGTCLPRNDRLLHSLVERIEHLALVLLMPVFFALAGLGTSTGAFTAAGFGALLLVLLVAVLGKVAGGGLGARWSGLSTRDSLAVGSLMNARGLMELIVMKVGLDAGLIGPEMFTLLLVLAIATTLMTGPLLALCGWRASPVEADAGSGAGR